MVQNVNDNNVHGIISENEVTVIKVAADWCEPCKKIEKDYESFSDKVSPTEVMYCSIDANENPDFCDEYEIRSVPTILVFKKGELANRFTGSECVKQLATIELI